MILSENSPTREKRFNENVIFYFKREKSYIISSNLKLKKKYYFFIKSPR